MKVTDLDPDMLDKCVAHALGLDRDLLETTSFKPSTDWGDGGPIIFGAGISFLSPRVTPSNDWQAGMGHPDLGQGWGPTPLIAAMRCFLACKYGDEVPAPDEWDGTLQSANGVPGMADTARQSVRVIGDSPAGATDYKLFDIAELRTLVSAALEIKRYQALLATRPQFDELTGLWNRDYFDSRLEEEVSLALRHRWPLSLILLDLDHFQQLNDQYGHPFGDVALRRVADTLLSNLRRGEIVCRYSAEFGIILREANAAQAEMAAERLRARIAGLEIEHGTEQVRITASLGIGSSEFLQKPQRFSPAALIASADEALRAAKRAGRNRTCRAG